jgi:hypothetical protein
MAAVMPLVNYWTKHYILADNALDTAYTCGEQSEIAFDVTGISVTAAQGFADTCSIYHTTAGIDYCLVFKGPVEADYPLQIEGLPVHLIPGDIIKAQATAGATHPLHLHISGIKQTRSPDAGGSSVVVSSKGR